MAKNAADKRVPVLLTSDVSFQELINFFWARRKRWETGWLAEVSQYHSRIYDAAERLGVQLDPQDVTDFLVDIAENGEYDSELRSVVYGFDSEGDPRELVAAARKAVVAGPGEHEPCYRLAQKLLAAHLVK